MAWTEWSQRTAYLMVKTDWQGAARLWKEAQRWPETIGAWMLTGSWDLMIWLDAKDVSELYERVVWLRGQSGVAATSSHFVYKGAKNGRWWWDWPVGNWVLVRSPHLNGELKSIEKNPWAVSAASIPGDWDYLVWVGGKKWEQVWDHVGDLSRGGWRTETLVPVKSWWNRGWKKRWQAWSWEREPAAAR